MSIPMFSGSADRILESAWVVEWWLTAKIAILVYNLRTRRIPSTVKRILVITLALYGVEKPLIYVTHGFGGR